MHASQVLSALSARISGASAPAFMLTALALTHVGCEPPHSEPAAFVGAPGARFYAVNPGDPTHQALTDATTVKYAETKSADALQLTDLPLDEMVMNCSGKVSEHDGVPAVVLVEPTSNTGAIWTENNKVTVLRKVEVEGGAQVDRYGTTVGGRVRVLYSMTDDQFKSALQWFAENPCATAGDDQ